MTTVYVGSTKADRSKQPRQLSVVLRPSEMASRNVSRVTTEFMQRSEDIVESAPSDALAVDKILRFQREYFKGREKPSIYDVVQMATEEVQYALDQGGDTGEQWYEESMSKVRSILTTQYPNLASDTEWDFFLAVLAVTSPGSAPKSNFRAAVTVYATYERTGKIPKSNPATGKAFSIASTANLTRFEKLIKRYETKAELVEFLNGVSTSGELRAIGAKISGQHDEAAFNSMVMGEKVGMFYQSMRGTEGAVTVDRWAIRSFYRWTGNLREGMVSGDVAGERDRGIDDTMSTEDRRNVEYVMQTVGDHLGLSARQVQAVMWYYEKRLYKKLGMGKLAAATDDFAKIAEAEYLQKSSDVLSNADILSDIHAMIRSGAMPTFRAFLSAIMEVRV